MRTFAEGQRSIEESAATPLQTAIGKWLGVLALYSMMLLITLVDVALLAVYGRPEWGWVAGGYLGLLLFGAAFVSLAHVLSAFTRSALIAGMLTFTVSLLFWTIREIVAFAPPAVSLAVSDLSLLDRFDDFAKGVIDIGNLLYYASLVALGLMLTAAVLRTRPITLHLNTPPVAEEPAEA
jgi:ABC-2 type transport system permease protein